MTQFISVAYQNIWGLGPTPEAARAQAAKYGGDDIEDLDTIKATERLANAIAAFRAGHPIYPEDIRWRRVTDNLADLVEEPELAKA